MFFTLPGIGFKFPEPLIVSRFTSFLLFNCSLNISSKLLILLLDPSVDLFFEIDDLSEIS